MNMEVRWMIEEEEFSPTKVGCIKHGLTVQETEQDCERLIRHGNACMCHWLDGGR